MERKLVLALVLALTAAVACDKLAARAKQEAAASASAASSAPAVASAPPAPSATAKAGDLSAANVADVKRFPDEKKLEPKKAKLEWGSSKVHAAPQGAVVAVLAKGLEVEEHAEHAGFYLITFPDPKDSSRTLAGWVYQDAFKAGPAKFSGPGYTKHAPGKSCPAGYALRTANDDICGKKCKNDNDCSGTDFCDGLQQDEFDGKGANVGHTAYCRHGND